MPLRGALTRSVTTGLLAPPLACSSAARARSSAVCREPGVATNVFLRDLNLGMPLSDGGCRERASRFGGVQVAVGATLVSPVRRDGTN